MTENIFAFEDFITQIIEKKKTHGFPFCELLNNQKCPPKILDASVYSWIFSNPETDVIQCDKNISESNNSVQITTSVENRCSQTLTNISGNTKYSCSVCLKSYKGKSGLRQHMASAHKIGDYKCQFCDAIFAFLTKLQEHTERHINRHLRPYDCLTCPSFFKRKRDLNIHKLNVHSVRKFECHICNLAYTTKNSLKYHQSIDHKD